MAEQPEFADPPNAINVYHPTKGWCPPDVAERIRLIQVPPNMKAYQCADFIGRASDAANATAYMMTGLQQSEIAKLQERCLRQEQYIGKMKEDERTLRAAQDDVLDAANSRIAELNERIAILEADNKAVEDRKDKLAEAYEDAVNQILLMTARIQHHKERFRHWRTRALQLGIELVVLKMQRHQSPQGARVDSTPPPPDSNLDETEKQDVIWRNATRFSR